MALSVDTNLNIFDDISATPYLLGTGIIMLMLAFQTLHARNQLAKRLVVSFISGDLSSAKTACPSPPQHPIPAHPTIFIF
jgi:hypothetical protein